MNSVHRTFLGFQLSFRDCHSDFPTFRLISSRLNYRQEGIDLVSKMVMSFGNSTHRTLSGQWFPFLLGMRARQYPETSRYSSYSERTERKREREKGRERGRTRPDDELSFHRGNASILAGSREITKEKRYLGFAAIPGIFPWSESNYSSMARWKLLLYILGSWADPAACLDGKLNLYQRPLKPPLRGLAASSTS